MWRDIDPRVPERERPEPGFGRVSGQTEVESGPVSDDPRDVFTRDLDLPRGSSRERVRVNDKEYRLSGDDVRVLATVGAFRVVPAGDLREPNPRTPTRPARDLERLRDRRPRADDAVRRRAHADNAGDAHRPWTRCARTRIDGPAPAAIDRRSTSASPNPVSWPTTPGSTART